MRASRRSSPRSKSLRESPASGRLGLGSDRALGKRGFARVSQRGSHVKLRNEAGRTAIVPLHRELAPGTLRSVLRQAGLSVDEFVTLIGSFRSPAVERLPRRTSGSRTTRFGPMKPAWSSVVAVSANGGFPLGSRPFGETRRTEPRPCAIACR
ncbi:MAG TPA: type II toxin-antitoxin system HicA family toxin [Gaiellaceae bacterium]|nr:type II toxin-antitoxin system HicA family toxin [Gaiellaceae bacterium]